ncbi:sensor histidine kinase [Pontibacter rugosus]
MDHSLASDNITSLFKDADGAVWVGNIDKGINLYNPGRHMFRRVTHMPHKNYWSEIGTVRAIAEDKDANLWIGTQEKGVVVLDKNYKYKLALQKELPSSIIRSIYEDSSGKVWIGHYEGLSCYDPRTGKVTNGFLEQYRHLSPYFRVYEIREDAEQNLWISFWFFLIKYNPRTGLSEHINLNKDLPPSISKLHLRCFDFTDDGTLWIGTENYGLLRYDTKKNKTTKVQLATQGPEGADPYTNILKLSFTNDNKLLLATSTGLCLYDPKTQKATYPKRKDKLNYQRTYAALEDKSKGIWVSTVNGMWYYHPQQDSIRFFDHSDGLSSNEFTTNGLLRRRDGTIVFGCNKGIVYFKPEQLRFNHNKPKVLLASNGWYTNNFAPIELEASQKSLKLQAKVISYEAPEKSRLAYRLKGWEENWHNLNAEAPTIFYENVPDGSYTLEIKGYREGQEQQASLLNIPLTKNPPVWKKSWFLLSLFTLSLGIAWVVYKRRINWIERDKELQIRNYESELKLLKSQISPHFLFNTLNNIYSLCILEPDKAGVMVMNLSKMLRYMLYECQDDQVPLAKELAFLEYYVYMQQEKGQQNNNISFNIKGKVEQQTIVPLLLINFLENSFKHSDLSINPHGYIKVEVEITDNQIMFQTKNTYSEQVLESMWQAGGIGIENARKRLQLFYPNKHELHLLKTNNLYTVQLIIWCS